MKHFDQDGNPLPEKQWHRQERRGKVEGWRRWVWVLAIFGWLLILASLVLFHYARPEFKAGLDSHWGLQAREAWDRQMADWLFYCTAVTGVLSLISLYINSRYQRRKTDGYWMNLIFLLLSSMVGIAWYLVVGANL